MNIYNIQLSIEYTVTGPTYRHPTTGEPTQHRLCGRWLERYKYDVAATDEESAKNYAVFEIDKIFAKRRNRYRNGIKWTLNKLTHHVCYQYTNTTVLRFHRKLKKRII